MKIALVGSAPSSVRLAPFGNPAWQIWGCSPGVYPLAPRVDAWFELHRWEPPVIGKADLQKPWFSPEYCLWMGQQKLVWMAEPVPEIPNSRRFPAEELVRKYGPYFFTSSLSWMFAMAIEEILKDRAQRNTGAADEIGLWGVDMAAAEEYGYQRAGCQFFAQIAEQLGIRLVVPPESDLLLPPPLYGIVESDHMMIKLTARKSELQSRLSQSELALQHAQNEVYFLKGAISDMEYMMGTWIQLDSGGAKFAEIFGANVMPPSDAPKSIHDIHGPDAQG